MSIESIHEINKLRQETALALRALLRLIPRLPGTPSPTEKLVLDTIALIDRRPGPPPEPVDFGPPGEGKP